MPPANHQFIKDHPKFQQLVRSRAKFGWTLCLAMLAVYYGFILLIAFDPQFLAQKVGDGVTTIGIPIGLGVIVFAFSITAFYVFVANTKYDALNSELMKEIAQ